MGHVWTAPSWQFRFGPLGDIGSPDLLDGLSGEQVRIWASPLFIWPSFGVHSARRRLYVVGPHSDNTFCLLA